MAHPSNAAVNFDSPSAAAAFNALQIGSGLDLGLPGLDGLGTLGRSSDDDLIKKLDNIIAILKVSPQRPCAVLGLANPLLERPRHC